MKPSMLKEKLGLMEPTLGSWITIPHPVIAEIMAKAGFDWLAIDLEHTMTSMSEAGHLIQVIELCGISALVRLTSNDHNQIKRALDAGAEGIIVPMVNSKTDAESAISATRYMPEGERGVGLYRAQKFGNGFREYVEWQKKGPVVIAQIEHIDAVKNISDILSVPELDGIFVGPYDLSCSMGIPGEFENPGFVEVLDEINHAAKSRKISSGIHVVEPDLDALGRRLQEGYTFIAYSVDMRVLDTGARKGTGYFQEVVN